MTLAVRGPRVLVRIEDQTVKQIGSLMLVEYDRPAVVGEVVAVGAVQDVAVGDVVIFGPEAGQEITFEDQPYLVMQEAEVMAVME